MCGVMLCVSGLIGSEVLRNLGLDATMRIDGVKSCVFAEIV
jgi:hypothetical protein